MTVRERKGAEEQFEVFELVDATDKDNNTVQIQYVKRVVTIAEIDRQIEQLTTQLNEWQGWKDEINILEA